MHTTQRITDDQVTDLGEGKTVIFSKEQLLRLTEYIPANIPLCITKLRPGQYEVFSLRLQSEEFLIDTRTAALMITPILSVEERALATDA